MAKILVSNSGPLHGEVWMSGAKNSVLPLLAATILTDDSCVIEDVPDLADVTVMKQMLENYGACIDDSEEGTIKIRTPEIVSCEGRRELVQKQDASGTKETPCDGNPLGLALAETGPAFSADGVKTVRKLPYELCGGNLKDMAILAAAGSLLLFFGLKDSPSDVGLPSPELLDEHVASKPVEETAETPEHAHALYKVLLKKMVFRNPMIWILAVSNFCVYVIRFTILDWGSMFLTDYKQLPIATAANVVAASEIVGGIIGTLLAGWITDKFFKSKAHHTCLIFMVMATLCFFAFWRMPQGSTGWAIFFLIMSSFFIYGPQALTGIAASNQATKRAAASANGILGIFGYASTTVSGLAFGMIAKSFGWNTVFAVAIAFGILGCLVFAAMWKAPADGYAKAEKIIEEFDSSNQ